MPVLANFHGTPSTAAGGTTIQLTGNADAYEIVQRTTAGEVFFTYGLSTAATPSPTTSSTGSALYTSFCLPKRVDARRIISKGANVTLVVRIKAAAAGCKVSVQELTNHQNQ